MARGVWSLEHRASFSRSLLKTFLTAPANVEAFGVMAKTSRDRHLEKTKRVAGSESLVLTQESNVVLQDALASFGDSDSDTPRNVRLEGALRCFARAAARPILTLISPLLCARG